MTYIIVVSETTVSQWPTYSTLPILNHERKMHYAGKRMITTVGMYKYEGRTHLLTSKCSAFTLCQFTLKTYCWPPCNAFSSYSIKGLTELFCCIKGNNSINLGIVSIWRFASVTNWNILQIFENWLNCFHCYSRKAHSNFLCYNDRCSRESRLSILQPCTLAMVEVKFHIHNSNACINHTFWLHVVQVVHRIPHSVISLFSKNGGF